ncbi:ErfK/YbiS/YcfS/YnhG family protein [Oceaniovalibus guishaninsula JLT2003]|uniref:ErfK/YbiS/YcfS/YnhG family protein n=1 Tax=Oceaniovalibus guishaninsula JLT2003 TaxID=1231392 RepID=K2HC71_9RHOB|nr:L,D-transpeptidase [Oceaniovalibus guishaninsula]EKE45068.1 ErfK/YbiS/YcfS/YnhG family protein [Oceaniovalibus guishaninsula JLT2003]
MSSKIDRRGLLIGTGAALFAPAIAFGAPQTPSNLPETSRHNMSAFAMQRWEDHFDNVDRVTLVADTGARALHYWAAGGGDYRLYPTSVPMSEELTRRGYSEIVRKREGPDWRPTASMKERDPWLPDYMPPGPGNPLGTHAMYLDWPAYLIHGTHDTRKIGRRSSSGCIGLYNEKIAELFAITPVGAQVRLI